MKIYIYTTQGVVERSFASPLEFPPFLISHDQKEAISFGDLLYWLSSSGIKYDPYKDMHIDSMLCVRRFSPGANPESEAPSDWLRETFLNQCKRTGHGISHPTNIFLCDHAHPIKEMAVL
jgi:hypothetical protein